MNTKDHQEIKLLSKKLHAAVNTISRNDKSLNTNKLIISHFLNLSTEFPSSLSTFSKLLNAWDKKQSTAAIQHLKPHMFNEAIIQLEAHLKSLGFSWDGNNFTKSDINSANANRLKGLIGVWKGFSWNKEETGNNKVPFYNVFRLEFQANCKVKCQTKNALFNSGFIGVIGTDRLVIEISRPDRRAYFTGSIGLNEDLSNVKILSFTYADTSNDHGAKCGLAILKRETILSFDEIEIRAMGEHEINEPEILSKLFEKQISAAIF